MVISEGFRLQWTLKFLNKNRTWRALMTGYSLLRKCDLLSSFHTCTSALKFCRHFLKGAACENANVRNIWSVGVYPASYQVINMKNDRVRPCVNRAGNPPRISLRGSVHAGYGCCFLFFSAGLYVAFHLLADIADMSKCTWYSHQLNSHH